MKVLLVTKPLVPPWTDSGKIVPRALALASSGRHALQVMVASGATGAWPRWVEPLEVYGSRGRYRPDPREHLRMMWRVWRRRASFDVLHFFFQPHPAAVHAARLLARACGRPCVHTVLSAPREPSPSLLFADRTVTLTHATAGAFAARGGATHAVIPPAIEESPPASPQRIAAARAEAAVDGAFLLYPGDFEFSGGHRFLVECWAAAPDLPPLVMTGRAKTPSAAAARAALEAECVRAGLGARIRFAGTVSDMPALIAASAALLFPARSLHAKTDLPLVILEAWREGRAVLASDLPPLAESIGAGGRALPLERDAWLAALRGLPAEASHMGAAGRAALGTRWSAAAAASAYEAVYDGIAGGEPGTRRNA
jgi:glycosyltransferase involved in cell wall biosynthesis